MGLTEGAGCPACETIGKGLKEEENGTGVGDITPLGGEFGAVNEKGLGSSVEEDSIGILGLLCERGFVIEDGIGGDAGGVLGLLCAKLLKEKAGLDIASGEMRGEEAEL